MVTYCEAIFERLQGQLVEIYIGDVYEQLSYTDNSKNTNAVLVGRVVDGTGDLLVIDAMYLDKHSKKPIHGNNVFINGYNIVGICPIDGRGTLKDAIMSIHSSANLENQLTRK